MYWSKNFAMHKCAKCEVRRAHMQRCAGCRDLGINPAARYCSTDCQTAAWPVHSKEHKNFKLTKRIMQCDEEEAETALAGIDANVSLLFVNSLMKHAISTNDGPTVHQCLVAWGRVCRYYIDEAIVTARPVEERFRDAEAVRTYECIAKQPVVEIQLVELFGHPHRRFIAETLMWNRAMVGVVHDESVTLKFRKNVYLRIGFSLAINHINFRKQSENVVLQISIPSEMKLPTPLKVTLALGAFPF